MSAAIALIFLAEAAATCSSSGASRLKAGATVVQAIVTAEPQSFNPAAPTTAASPADEAERGGSPDVDDAEPAQPTDECDALPIPIV
jgi:hypothetical protein